MRFEEMKQALIRAAEQAGLKEYEIYYQMDESVSAETLKDEISSFSSSVGGGVNFRCIVDGKMGYASGERMTEEAMEEMVANAISNARVIDNDDEVFIYAGSPSYAKLPESRFTLASPEVVRDTALRLQRETYAESDRVGDGTQTLMLSATSEIRICNSHGLDLSNRGGISAAYVAPVVRDGEDSQDHLEIAEGNGYADFAHLPSKAVRNALDKFGATTIDSGKYDVIFDGKQFRQFLATFAPIFSAKQAQLGLSLLAGKEGEKVAAECVTVTDDPMREGAAMQTPFDSEGVATAKRNVIENGILKTLLHNLTTAKKAGVESTGNGQKSGYAASVAIAPYNFSIKAGTDDEDALFAALGNGIYITECKGFHAGANAVTGDFSIESAGFMIRDGKRAEPIKSFTISGNFFELLLGIDRIGNEVKWGLSGGFTVFGSPDILIRNASIAGK